MKKIIVIAMSVILLFSAMVMPIDAAQAENEIAQPYWTNTNRIVADIGFIDGVGYAEASLTGKFGSTRASIDVIVYEQVGEEWVYLTEMHVTSESMSAMISCDFPITLGTNYKAEYMFTVVKNGTGEAIARIVYDTYTG